jgi:hypothetical protein
MRAAERDANAADDGDATSLLVTHVALRAPRVSSICARGTAVRVYHVVFLRAGAPYNPGMRAIAAVSILGAMSVLGCAASDPEREIRALLAAAEEAAEARDAGFFGDLLGASYQDARGNDRDAALRMIRGYFIANQRVEIVSRVDEVRVEGADAARAVVHAGMVGQRAGGGLVPGVDADLYRFELELVNDDGDWRIIGASWSRALGE